MFILPLVNSKIKIGQFSVCFEVMYRKCKFIFGHAIAYRTVNGARKVQKPIYLETRPSLRRAVNIIS